MQPAYRLSRAGLDEHMENEITDLQQRLDLSKHEQSDDVGSWGWGFNKLLLATSIFFSYLSTHNLTWISVNVCVCVCLCIVMCLKLQSSL